MPTLDCTHLRCSDPERLDWIRNRLPAMSVSTAGASAAAATSSPGGGGGARTFVVAEGSRGAVGAGTAVDDAPGGIGGNATIKVPIKKEHDASKSVSHAVIGGTGPVAAAAVAAEGAAETITPTRSDVTKTSTVTDIGAPTKKDHDASKLVSAAVVGATGPVAAAAAAAVGAPETIMPTASNVSKTSTVTDGGKTPTTATFTGKTPEIRDDEGSEEMAWKCHGCSRHNLLRRLKCPACGCWKGGSKSSTRTSTAGCEIVWGAEGDGGKVRGKKKRKRRNNDGECYICCDGGLLVCCDYCEKSFHMHCHIPPLHDVPSGKWMCCECAAPYYSRKWKCGTCEACLREDCGKCSFCLDKPKFGGKSLLNQACERKRCPYKRYAPPATVTPKSKRAMSRGSIEGIADEPAAPEDEANEKQAAVGSPASLVEAAASGCRKCKRELETGGKICGRHGHSCPRKNLWRVGKLPTPASPSATAAARAAAATAPLASRNLSKAATVRRSKGACGPGSKARGRGANAKSGPSGDGPRAPSVEASAGDGADVLEPADPPVLQADVVSIAAADNGGSAPNDLRMCRMELERAREENKRRADEIERLKSAARALTAALTGAPSVPRAGDSAAAADADDAGPDDLPMCQMELKRARAEGDRKAGEIERLKLAVRALTASLTG